MKTDWAELLGRAMSGQADTVPDEWRTTEQIAAEICRSVRCARFKIQQAMRAGTVERREFRIENGGVIRPVPHYRQVTPKRAK